MKITIESTTEVCDLDGVQCRRWKGETKDGAPCDVFVHRIGANDDASEFAYALAEKPAPETHRRAKALVDQILQEWDPPEHGLGSPDIIAKTATMLAIAAIVPEVIPPLPEKLAKILADGMLLYEKVLNQQDHR